MRSSQILIFRGGIFIHKWKIRCTSNDIKSGKITPFHHYYSTISHSRDSFMLRIWIAVRYRIMMMIIFIHSIRFNQRTRLWNEKHLEHKNSRRIQVKFIQLWNTDTTINLYIQSNPTLWTRKETKFHLKEFFSYWS